MSLTSIEQFFASAVARIDRSVALTDQALAGGRIVFGIYIVLFATYSFQWMAELPAAFYAPQTFSVFRLLDGPPPVWIMRLGDGALVLCAVGIAVGYRTRWSTWGYVVIYLTGWGLRNSYGKIDHGLLTPYLLAALSFSGWGKHSALRPEKALIGGPFPRVAAAVFVCFGMLTAGAPKLLGWVDFDLGTSGFLNWFYSGYFNFGRRGLLMEWVLYFPPWLLEATDYAAVILEISGFFFLFVGPRAWRAWILGAAGFHFGATLLLNISFQPHLPVYALFLAGAWASRLDLSPRRLRNLAWLLVLPLAWQLYLRLTGNPAFFLLTPKQVIGHAEYNWVCAVLWPAIILLGIWDIRRLGQPGKMAFRPPPPAA